MGALQSLRMHAYAVKRIVQRYFETPRLVRNWRRWALRRALMPYEHIPVWLTSLTGSRYYLGADPIDDRILVSVLQNEAHLYFPTVQFGDVESPLMLDIGAHHGFVTIGLLERYPNARLIAVEPNPAAINLLRTNLRANGFSERTEIVHAAIARQDGSTFLAFGNGSWADTTSVPEGEARLAEGISVPALSLGSILSGRQPQFVKCNAEGAEYIAIPQLFALGLRPRFMIVMAHPEFGSVDDLVAEIEANSYSVRQVSKTPIRPCYHCQPIENDNT